MCCVCAYCLVPYDVSVITVPRKSPLLRRRQCFPLAYLERHDLVPVAAVGLRALR